MMFTEDDFKDFFLGPDGEVWKLALYCEHPTATFARVDDPEIKRGGAVGSEILRGFQRLVPEAEHTAVLRGKDAG